MGFKEGRFVGLYLFAWCSRESRKKFHLKPLINFMKINDTCELLKEKKKTNKENPRTQERWWLGSWTLKSKTYNTQSNIVWNNPTVLFSWRTTFIMIHIYGNPDLYHQLYSETWIEATAKRSLHLEFTRRHKVTLLTAQQHSRKEKKSSFVFHHHVIHICWNTKLETT